MNRMVVLSSSEAGLIEDLDFEKNAWDESSLLEVVDKLITHQVNFKVNFGENIILVKVSKRGKS